MKNVRIFTFVLILGALVLSACGPTATSTPAPVTTSGSTKVDAMPVAFVGIVDSIAGDQWVISGTTVTVDEAVVRDGPFNVGDQVKVEGLVHPDGSFTISRVEAPTPQEAATLTPPSVDNSNESPINANSNDSNVNDDNSNSSNSNDSNSNDDNGGGSNTNDDNSNDGNSNDDNGGGSNTNDDNSNDSNSNDDNGGGNSNDDNSGGGGGNDDSGGDDNGGGGNGNDD